MAENFDELFNVPLTESTEAVAAAAASSSSTAGTSNTAAANRDRSGSSTTVSLDNSTASSGSTSELVEYRPLNYHWFYSSSILDKLIWIPMSFKDSENLEKAYADKKEQIRELRKNPSGERKSSHIVTVKGGRFEVDLVELIRRPIYWDEEKTCFVKRCLWFYKENNEEFMPYDEDYCEFLEIEYEKSLKNNTFHKRIDYIRIVDIDAESAEKNKQTDQQQQQQQKQQEKQQEKTPEERQQSVCLEEAFVFHSASVMLHYTQAAHSLDELGNLMTSDARRPRVVKRGLDDVISRDKIEPDELDRVDHVCFVVHGIGEGCDLKFRTLVECVDDFRDLSAFIIDSHLRQHVEQNNLQGRIEFIPITWHDELHGDATGVDERLKPITLPSIPKLRQYSNTTILDVLFYTSPIYCQTIISKVGNELNRLYQVFIERNPYFCGNVSLVGHSLGSLILFDLLLHQSDAAGSSNASPSNQMTSLENMNLQQHEEENIAQKSTAETSVKAVLERLKLNEYSAAFEREKISMDSLYMLSESDLVQMGLPMGPRRVLMHEIRNRLLQREREEVGKKIKTNLKRLREAQAQAANNADENKSSGDYFNYGLAGTGQLIIKYPQLYFKAKNFFALGSPIAVFLAVRGIEKLSTDFKLPTCDGFFNIFHPYDPIAYRFEPLINKAPVILPVLMPHHKGRKRLHLELKENFNKVSEDLKQKVVEQFRTTWSSLTEFAKMPRLGNSAATAAVTGNTADDETAALITAVQQTESSEAKTSSEETQPIGSIVGETNVDAKYDLGRLNNGRRIDYILQERPIESFNEYLFALASHACYWESEDTVLLLVKEVYGVGNTIDANTELSVSEQQQQLATWFTQTASLPLKQFSTYLGTFGNLGNFGNFVMPSIGSVINRAPNSSTSTAAANTTTATSPTTSSNASNTQKTEPSSDKSSK